MKPRGRATSEPSCVPNAHGHCEICGDEAKPGLVRAVDDVRGTGEVQVDGVVQTVALDLLDHVAPGDTILVHQGFAITRLDDA